MSKMIKTMLLALAILSVVPLNPGRAQLLRPGEKVRVKTYSGGLSEGRLLSLRADSLTIAYLSSDRSFSLEEIDTLYYRRPGYPPYTRTGIGVGLAVGAGIALLIEKPWEESFAEFNEVTLIAIPLIGAGLGAAIGSAFTHYFPIPKHKLFPEPEVGVVWARYLKGISVSLRL